MINILFGGNNKAFKGILLCLLSAIKHTSSPLNVYVLTADLTEINNNYNPITNKQIELLNKVIQEKNKNSKVKLIKLNKNFNNWVMSSKNKFTFYTPFAFLRLFATEIKNLPNKIIYLDTDIMINDNLQKLFDIDISNYELGVVKDRYGRFFINHNYFNSGMLLMNMEKLKQTNLFEKVKNTCLNRKMAFPDQSALNKHCKNKLYIPRKFNEQGKLREDTVIHHFCKKIKWLPFFHTINIKPWQIDDVRNKYKCFAYDDIYNQYEKLRRYHIEYDL